MPSDGRTGEKNGEYVAGSAGAGPWVAL
jgi:hypothetical protein